MAHQHEWIGDADGVVCKECGKRLTAKQYADSLKKKKEKKDNGKGNG